MKDLYIIEDISTELIQGLSKELPGRYFTSRKNEKNEFIIFEYYKDSILNGKIFYTLNEKINCISVNKNFNEKKDKFIARFVANEISVKYGFLQNANYLEKHTFNLISIPDYITFVLRKELEIYRTLENFEGFGFSLIENGNKFNCHYKGVCFRLKFLFKNDKIHFFFSYLTNKNSSSTKFNQKSNFSIEYNEVAILPQKISSELKKILITNIFNTNNEVYSFVKDAINTKLIFKFCRSETVTEKMIDFLKKELNVTDFELENLYLSRSNEYMKSKVNFGEYRLGINTNDSQENIIFTHKIRDDLIVTVYLYNRSN